MTQRQQWRSGGGEQAVRDQAWLALLVETFETVSREPIKTLDSATIAALKARLARPAAATVPSFIALH